MGKTFVESDVCFQASAALHFDESLDLDVVTWNIDVCLHSNKREP